MPREKTREELEREKRAKSLSYEKKLNNKNNKFIIFSVVFILIGYIFFFISPKLFHEKPERFYTDIGSTVVFTGGSITPNSWVFAEARNMMQVEFTFKSNQVIAPNIEVNAATSFNDRTKAATRLKSDIIYHENDFYIANIYDIPEDYYCVSLRIRTAESKSSETTAPVNNNDGIGNEVIRQLNETTSATEATEKTSTAVIYTCRDAVDIIRSLYPLDDYIYRIKRIQSNINADYAIIAENNAAIDTLKGTNTEYELKNDELRNDMLYMTSSERQKLEAEIESNESKIGDNIAQIRGKEESNLALQNEIQEYSEIIKRIAAENEGREYTAPTQSTEPTEANIEPLREKPTVNPTEPAKAPTVPPTVSPTQAKAEKKN